MGNHGRPLLRPGLWVGGGLLATTAIACADLFGEDKTIPLIAIALGPFLAALGAPTMGTAIVAVYALAASITVAGIESEFSKTAYIGRILAIAILGLAAVALTAVRTRRDAELAIARTRAAEGRRLRIALDAGAMGTWTWERAVNRVTWDTHLCHLFGIEPGSFPGTFEAWVELLHPDDRDRALFELNTAIEEVRPFAFDHRVTWPDGSVHWIEGRGEPVLDKEGNVIGATGVAIDVDVRVGAEQERVEILDRERVARTAAEESSDALQRLTRLTLALSNALTVDDVAAAGVKLGTVALRARYGWLATVDPGSDELVTRAYEGYPPEVIEPYLAVPLDTPLPGTEALRGHDAIFIDSAEDRRERFPMFPETGVHGSLAAAPIALGTDGRAVLAFGYADARPFTPETRAYISAVIEACSAALRRAASFEAEQASRARLRTLLELSEAISGLDDPDAVLETTARFAADRIGRYASVYVVEPDGLRRVSTLHSDPSLDASLEALAALGTDGRVIAERVAADGEGILVQRTAATDWTALPEEAQELLALIHPTSVMVVPMRISDQTLGVIIIGHDASPAFGAADLELAIDVGRRTAAAHERAVLRQASEQQFEIEHEMVQVLQRSITPEQLPDIPGTQLAAEYRPAGQSVDVGGDWYDAFELDDAIMLVVGDVAGHGIDAARLMVRVRNAFRAYAVEEDDPGRLLGRVDYLLRTFERHEMVTAVVVRYDPATGDVAWSRAGHLPPLLCDGDGGTRFLDDVNAPPLGTLADGFRTAEARLGPGSLLVLYTDGLVERRDHIIDDGLEWLADRVRARRNEPLSIVCRSLTDDPFVPHPSPDDICVLALRASAP